MTDRLLKQPLTASCSPQKQSAPIAQDRILGLDKTLENKM